MENVQELIDEFRDQVDDVAKPYLFSETAVLRYAIDAQDMFVRLTGGIPDVSTPQLTEIPVVAETPLQAHSPYILRIRSAKLLTAKRALRVIREADLAVLSVRDYGLVTPMYLDDTDTGDVVAMVLGVEKNKVRWYKVPAEDATTDTCKMNILRLPYPRIKEESDTLEIDEQHHLHLVMWMKHLAYSKEDAETYDKELAEKNEAAFRAYCKEAKQEEERQRYRPRVVQYGGL